MIKTKEFQKYLLEWFAAHGRDLPWRHTYLPYHIWISEIMLQQTQMDRVVEYFNRWVRRLPDIASVASASEEQILKLWEGLGYYSRARNIRRCAAILMQKHKGHIPDDYSALLSLPGIGPYTAAALVSIAFNRDYPVVDANVERVFSRLFDIRSPVKQKENITFIRKKAKKLLPHGRSRFYNQALMELGALICQPKNPDCINCPIRSDCKARILGIQNERPMPVPSKETVFIDMATAILLHNGKIFIQKRLKKDVWAGLWEFPGGRIKKGESPAEAVVREFYEETELRIGHLEEIISVKHSYTIYRVTLHGYYCRLTNGLDKPVLHAAQEYRWVSPDELSAFAFPAGHRRLLEHISKERDLTERISHSLNE